MGRFKGLFILVIIASWIFLEPQFVFSKNGEQEEQVFVLEGDAYLLSLEEVTQLALQNNFDIQLAKYDAQIARTDEGVAESIYDTIIEAEIDYRDNQRGRTSTISGSKSLENNYKVGVSKKLPTGTTIEVDGSNNRNWTNSTFATLNPSHDAAVEVTLKQDLGKNFFGIQDRGDVKITRIDIENSEYISLEKIEQNVADTQKAYWDLVLKREQVKIEQRMVEQAKRLFDLHREKFVDGLTEEPELLAAEANYRERVSNLMVLQDEVKTKENVLKLLLNITNDEIRLVPKENFGISDQTEQLDLSLAAAFENRRDYKRFHNDIKSKNIKLSMEKNNIWPEINLTASFERNGIGGHFDKAFENISEEDNPNWFTGVTVSFPLENREAKSKLKAAEIEKAKALVNLKYIERRIAIGINDQVRNCNVLKETAISRQRIADLQSQKLLKEEKRFQYGRSDTDTIIRFQEDSLQAEFQAQRAKFEYYSSLIDLRQREGTLLNAYWEGDI